MTGMRGVSATVRRRRLGAQLRRYRESAGVTIEHVAEHVGCSTSKISRLETGLIGASPEDVRRILSVLKVDAAESGELLVIAEQTRQRGWWHRQGALLSSEFVAFEQAASRIDSYEAQCVPGLVQTEEYARAILGNVAESPDQVERRLRLRMRRGSLLAQDDPVQFWCVIDEAALRRPVGGEAVMRQQLEHLAAMSAVDNVTLQVLPLRVGAHPGMDGSFAVLHFDHDSDADTVYVAFATGGFFQEKSEEVGRYRWIFDRLTSIALTPEDSTAFLQALARE